MRDQAPGFLLVWHPHVQSPECGPRQPSPASGTKSTADQWKEENIGKNPSFSRYFLTLSCILFICHQPELRPVITWNRGEACKCALYSRGQALGLKSGVLILWGEGRMGYGKHVLSLLVTRVLLFSQRFSLKLVFVLFCLRKDLIYAVQIVP